MRRSSTCGCTTATHGRSTGRCAGSTPPTCPTPGATSPAVSWSSPAWSGAAPRRTRSGSSRPAPAAGAVALAAGEAVFHGVPPDVVEACRRHDLPLLSVPEHVSFSALTEFVVGRVTAWRGAQLAATLDRQRQLLQAVAEGRSLDELVGLVGAETGLTCRVLTATGRAVVRGPRALPPEDLDRVTRAFLTADRLPAVAGADAGGSGAPYSVFPGGSGARPADDLVVRRGRGRLVDLGARTSPTPSASSRSSPRWTAPAGTRGCGPAGTSPTRPSAWSERGAGGQPETQVRLRQAGVSGDAPPGGRRGGLPRAAGPGGGVPVGARRRRGPAGRPGRGHHRRRPGGGTAAAPPTRRSPTSCAPGSPGSRRPSARRG